MQATPVSSGVWSVWGREIRTVMVYNFTVSLIDHELRMDIGVLDEPISANRD